MRLHHIVNKQSLHANLCHLRRRIDSSLKILHLIPYMHPSAGGPPVVVDQWCAELGRRGWQPEVLTTNAYADGANPSWIQEYAAKYPIEVLPFFGPPGFGYSRQLKRALIRKLTDCDVVHVHNIWSYCNRIAAQLCVTHGVPFVVSTHGMLDPHSMGRKPWKKRLYGHLIEWPSLRNASGIVFTHSEEERLARETCSVLPLGFIVPLGTEDPPTLAREQLRTAFLQDHPELSGGPRVLFLSRLHPKKGLDLLLPAFSDVLKQIPDATLVLTGPGDPDFLRYLKAKAARCGISDRTVFTGPLHGIAKWQALAAADVYVLPSYQENFAIALVEALRAGTPVVCSQRINLWEDLAKAGAATICDLTVESVSSRILAVLQNPEMAVPQSRRAIDFSATNYTWEKSVDRLIDVYRSLKAENF
jgi:glycosyltransferase involved in cell wall biosynthesis